MSPTSVVWSRRRCECSPYIWFYSHVVDNCAISISHAATPSSDAHRRHVLMDVMRATTLDQRFRRYKNIAAKKNFCWMLWLLRSIEAFCIFKSCALHESLNFEVKSSSNCLLSISAPDYYKKKSYQHSYFFSILLFTLWTDNLPGYNPGWCRSHHIVSEMT